MGGEDTTTGVATESYTSVETPVPYPVSTQVQCGLDLGKLRDHSVLAVTSIERFYLGLKMVGEKPSYLDVHGGYHPTEPILVQQFRTVYTLRHMESFQLKTPYELVAQRSGEIFDALAADMPGTAITLYVDYTGVGTAVLEIIQKELRARPGVCQRLPVRPITLTGGTHSYKPGDTSCSKFSLVSNMLARMGAHIPELQIPHDLEYLTATIEELRAYQEHLRQESGNASYDGGRPGIKDDRVIALGLSLLPPIGEVRYSNRIF